MKLKIFDSIKIFFNNNKYKIKKTSFLIVFGLAISACPSKGYTTVETAINNNIDDINYDDDIKEDTVIEIQNEVIEVLEETINIDNVEEEIPVIEDTIETKEELKLVALTFDDGPCKHTEEIKEILEENNALASFFIKGANVKGNNVERLSNLKDMGCDICIHCWDHKHSFTKEPIEDVTNEIEKTINILKENDIEPTLFVRTPGGSINNKVLALDYTFIYWTCDSRDWENHNTDKMRIEIDKHIKPGAIILCHDIHATTIEAMKILIPEYIEQGYKFVTLTELFDYYNVIPELHKMYKIVEPNEEKLPPVEKGTKSIPYTEDKDENKVLIYK